MKFENIKEGDKVLAPISIRYGFGKSRVFLITKEVTRLTKTQFLIGDIRASKNNGLIIGINQHRYVRLMNEEKNPPSKGVFIDETMEMKEFKRKRNLLNELNQDDPNLSKIGIDTDVSKLEIAVEVKKRLMKVCLNIVSGELEK